MKRKDALWVMQMCRDRDARSEAEREAFDMAIEALKGESIFYADRPRGYWKDGKWCSVCGMPIATDVWGTSVDESEVHYCIECGAEMRGEDE